MYKPYYRGKNDGEGPSAAVWSDLDVFDIKNDRNKGVFFYEDFTKFGPNSSTASGVVTEKNGGWSTFLSQGGAIAAVDATNYGGGINLSADGDNEAVVLHTNIAPFTLPYGKFGRRFAFEARVKTSTIADTKHGIFVGLAETFVPTAILPITAAGAIADKNVVGFHRLEGDGDYFDTIYKADGQTQGTVQADAALLVADTWTKLGMYFDGKVLHFFQDGAELSSTYTLVSTAGNPFPNDVSLGICLAIVNATGSTPGSSSVSWVQAALQL